MRRVATCLKWEVGALTSAKAKGTFAITFAATLEVVTRYRQWKQKEIVRLQSESKIIETALGPVETEACPSPFQDSKAIESY